MTGSVDLWYWPTPNGRKVTILLEELGLAYQVHPVSIRDAEQFDPAFLALSPNNKIPVLRDTRPADGGPPLVIWESGAILTYLADRHGQFLPQGRARWAVTQWLMFQMAGVGPMHGQANHFHAYIAEPNPYAQSRYHNETRRLYGIVDQQLARSTWLAGDALSIADFAVFPWAAQMDRAQIERSDFAHLSAWFDRLQARPAVQRGMAVLADRASAPRMTEAERDVMFGHLQYAPRTPKGQSVPTKP